MSGESSDWTLLNTTPKDPSFVEMEEGKTKMEGRSKGVETGRKEGRIKKGREDRQQNCNEHATKEEKRGKERKRRKKGEVKIGGNEKESRFLLNRKMK